METFGILFWVAAVVGAVLETILFFKLWRACDNIKRIADKYAPDLEKEQEKRNRPRSSVETKEELEKWLNGGK